jgi:hypothetical protein
MMENQGVPAFPCKLTSGFQGWGDTLLRESACQGASSSEQIYFDPW